MTEQILGYILTAVASIFGSYLIFRVGKRAAKNDYTATLATRIQNLETRVTQLEGHKSVLTNYATELRQYIDEQKPPPPPPWPVY